MASSSAPGAVGGLGAILAVVVLAFNPRLALLVAFLALLVFLVVRRIERRRGVLGAAREQFARLRDDNTILGRSLLGDLERHLDLAIDTVIDAVMGKLEDTETEPSAVTTRRSSARRKIEAIRGKYS
ncbi:Uncharacterized protein PBTT_01288 [Plasmodiophora brassicae]|uniref:Uncharacterized protein n=1 Tax=Plasmodiophora brassicae TaxID=37360 RepID=A0A0G4IZ86_PLABS|nr:hypothetical protein PBRA_001503 [Plasmodiophora brassicae]SPQ94048.1 unnamed protein product [Plasmodiophora brassicae]